ncbi:MAG: class II aldolase/adducin family protein [Candidatus Omnitrophica bacterium]|nr:class II aldolase/adducin family protein [Candidatus Omnitrophota bacterium]
MDEKALKREIIKVGRRLYEAGIAVARSGNISARLDDKALLITASGTYLGDLAPGDIVRVGLDDESTPEAAQASSELPMHRLIYRHFPCKVIIHAHPPLSNGYFAVCDSLKPLTFETAFYLGDVPVVPQDTPTVTRPNEVIAALKGNNLVVLKNHGSVAVGESFEEGLSLIEALEEAVKTLAIARLFKKDVPDSPGGALQEQSAAGDEAYEMFSRAHIQAIVNLVNQDDFIAAKGRELHLTVELAIKLDGTDKAFRFSFEEGRIVRLSESSEAPFVISAGRAVWEQVFAGKLDSFVAVTQGKMKLQGALGQLSKWYVPFSRLFQLFKQVRFK